MNIYQMWATGNIANYNEEIGRWVDSLEDGLFCDGWQQIYTSEQEIVEAVEVTVEATTDIDYCMISAGEDYDNPEDWQEFMDVVKEDLSSEIKDRITDRIADEELDSIITAAEAADEFGLTPSTVTRACEYGWIPARKAGRIWLIRREDAESRWKKD